MSAVHPEYKPLMPFVFNVSRMIPIGVSLFPPNCERVLTNSVGYVANASTAPAVAPAINEWELGGFVDIRLSTGWRLRYTSRVRECCPRSMANVVLLRAPSNDLADPYEEAFRDSAYHPLSVPVLETTLTNLDRLATVLGEHPHARRFTGVIMTSARACEAWKEAVTRLLADGALPVDSQHAMKWSSLPFYVVGEATAKALAAVRELHGDTDLTPVDICGASESGSGERLADFIVDDVRRRRITNPKLLYLTGDKNRDALPNILNSGGIGVDFLQVYQTQCSPSFTADLEAAINGANPEQDNWWIVFFAPSAAKAALPALRTRFSIGPSDTDGIQHLKTARLTAIGPTTAKYLSDVLNIHVDAVAVKPTPRNVMLAITEYDCATIQDTVA